MILLSGIFPHYQLFTTVSAQELGIGASADNTNTPAPVSSLPEDTLANGFNDVSTLTTGSSDPAQSVQSSPADSEVNDIVGNEASVAPHTSSDNNNNVANRYLLAAL